MNSFVTSDKSFVTESDLSKIRKIHSIWLHYSILLLCFVTESVTESVTNATN